MFVGGGVPAGVGFEIVRHEAGMQEDQTEGFRKNTGEEKHTHTHTTNANRAIRIDNKTFARTETLKCKPLVSPLTQKDSCPWGKKKEGEKRRSNLARSPFFILILLRFLFLPLLFCVLFLLCHFLPLSLSIFLFFPFFWPALLIPPLSMLTLPLVFLFRCQSVSYCLSNMFLFPSLSLYHEVLRFFFFLKTPGPSNMSLYHPPINWPSSLSIFQTYFLRFLCKMGGGNTTGLQWPFSPVCNPVPLNPPPVFKH